MRYLLVEWVGFLFSRVQLVIREFEIEGYFSLTLILFMIPQNSDPIPFQMHTYVIFIGIKSTWRLNSGLLLWYGETLSMDFCFLRASRTVYVEITSIFCFKHEGVYQSIFKFQQCRAGKSPPAICPGICYRLWSWFGHKKKFRFYICWKLLIFSV